MTDNPSTRRRTKHGRVFLILFLSVAGLALAFGAIRAFQPNLPAYAAGFAAATQQGGFQHGRSHGWGGRGLAHLCGDRRDEHIDAMTAFVEGFVGFTPPQTQAWADLTEALRAGSASVGEACDELEATSSPDTASALLARVETIAVTGLSVVREVRPTFDAFYGTLSEKQKKALDDLISHRRRHAH